VELFGDILYQVNACKDFAQYDNIRFQIFEKIAGSSRNAKHSMWFTGYFAFYKTVQKFYKQISVVVFKGRKNWLILCINDCCNSSVDEVNNAKIERQIPK
jgi:hypothetical protein